jgi:hypothetical protein
MSKLVTDESWVWAVIQNPEGEALLVGQHDKENNITFVPVFLEKEEALKCYNLLSLAKGQKYEVQAPSHSPGLMPLGAVGAFGSTEKSPRNLGSRLFPPGS